MRSQSQTLWSVSVGLRHRTLVVTGARPIPVHILILGRQTPKTPPPFHSQFAPEAHERFQGVATDCQGRESTKGSIPGLPVSAFDAQLRMSVPTDCVTTALSLPFLCIRASKLRLRYPETATALRYTPQLSARGSELTPPATRDTVLHPATVPLTPRARAILPQHLGASSSDRELETGLPPHHY